MNGEIEDDQFDGLMQDLASGGRWDLVLRLAREQLASAPECADAHRWAAWGELHTGDEAAAKLHAEALQSDEPDEASTFRLWAELHFQGGRWDEARASLEEAIARWPENADYHRKLCCIHLKRNDVAAAIHSAKETLRLDPENLAARFALILIQHECLGGFNRLDQQLSELMQLLADDPNNAAILAQIGEVYLLRRNEPISALPFLQQALANDPNNERIERLYHMASCWIAAPASTTQTTPAHETTMAVTTPVDAAAPLWLADSIVAAADPQAALLIDAYAACIDGNSCLWTCEAVEEMLIS